MADMYKVPGQHEHDGMRLFGGISANVVERIRNELVLTSEDILSVSYPKTGCTWVNEILFLIQNGADEEKVRNTPRVQRYPYIELDIPELGMAEGSRLKSVMGSPPPRLIKSHLPVRYFTRQLHSEGPKIIVTMRNPKDILVSAYHFYRMNRMLGNFTGSWDEFFELYRHDGLIYEDMFKYHVDWYAVRHHPNVLLLKYEDMHKDIKGKVREILTFLGKEFTEDKINKVVQLSSFDSQGKDEPHPPVLDVKISKFFRKGVVGDWKNYFNDEQNDFLNKRYKDMYEPAGLDFEFE